MTLGGTSTNGSLAAASHAGLGAPDGAINTTNATYGSITDPTDFGSGGGGSASCCTVGGNGGGVATIRASAARVVLAGAIRADGGTGFSAWAPGAGGSILSNVNRSGR